MGKVVLSAVALSALAWLTGCSTTATSAPVDSGVATDGAGTPVDAGTTPDSSAMPDAGPSCHPVGVTQAACRACCDNAYPTGATSFDKYLLTCACAANYCGPLDAGVSDAGAGSDDGGDAGASDAGASDAGASEGGTADAAPPPADSGPFGNGTCTQTCSGLAMPDQTCNDCFNAAIGSVNSAGPCQSYVLSQCLTDTACNAYLGCVENCP